MITGTNRLRVLTQMKSEDDGQRRRKAVKSAVEDGLAIVLLKPCEKTPVCTLPKSKRGKKDHDCGFNHAITEPEAVYGAYDNVQRQYPGQHLNIGIHPRKSNLAVIDVDNPGQLEAFLKMYPGLTLTVSSPGKQNEAGEWVHHGGGHIYFDTTGIELPNNQSVYTHPDEHWVLIWGDYNVVAPPSVRAEGAYLFGTPEVLPLPQTLIDRVWDLPHWEATGPRDGPTEIDVWSEGPWTLDLLRPEDGWVITGRRDNCGCPIWWVHGRSDRKSATAHEEGCASSKVDTSTGHGLLKLWTTEPPDFLREWRSTHSRVTKLRYLALRDFGGDIHAAMESEGINPASVDVEGLEFEVPADDGPEEQAQPVTPAGLVLPGSFWESMDVLSYVRRVAHTRGVSADGLLYTVLAWTSAIVPHQCRLDTGMVSDKGASLNLFVARVGDSGGGKSASADDLARELIRPDVYLIDMGETEALPLGTGEGLVEHYMDKVDTGQKHTNGKAVFKHQQVRHNGFFTADEGEAFDKLKERGGSTLGATTRSAWYGTTIGNQNADPDKRRILPSGSYALGTAIGWQPDTIESLLADDAKGTPQRFIYAWVHDPNLPDERPEVQEPIIPRALKAEPGLVGLDPAIKAEWWKWQTAKSKRTIQVPRRDAHAHLTKGKIAANLTLLDQRDYVTAKDWELAGVIWETSCRVRDWLIKQSTARKKQEAEARDDRIVEREGRAEAERRQVAPKVERIARNLAKYVHVDGDRTTAAATRRLDSKDYGYAPPAWEYAAAAGWVILGEPLPRGKNNRAVSPGPSRPADAEQP